MSGASAAAVVFGLGTFTEEAVSRPRFGANPFGLGVASGDPEPDGVVLWTRLDTGLLGDDLQSKRNKKIPVRWEVAADESFRKVVRRGTEFARPELGHSVHVEVGGLAPAREYYYRFKAGPETSPVGRTKTTPEPGASVSELSFAFASCQMYEHGYFTAYRRMAEEDLDLVINLGDYIYEYGPGGYPSPTGNVRQHQPASEITTLSDYRTRHAQYRSDEDLQAAHAAFPWLVTWDDHEVENNYADEISEDNVDPEAFLARRAAAYQAYYEHMPLRLSSVPDGPNLLLYRRLTFGNLAEFNVLDTRQYRDDQANGDGLKAPSRESRSASRTLTGEAQESWLFDGLSRSQARWNVLAQQVFFSELDLRSGPGEIYNMDAWDGYEAQRNRIVDFLARGEVSNPVVLTGDIHLNWANDIKAEFSDPASRTVGTEFVGTSITSGGNGSGTTNYGSPIAAENEHIKFFNDLRGYVRCTVTPERWQADYRVLPFVNQPGAPVTTLASFVAENGNPGAQRSGGAPATTQRNMPDIEEDRVGAQQKAARG